MDTENHDLSAVVFNIQRYSVHDGPGIRTIVFLKGCPLRCPWCSNPEGLEHKPELSHSEQLCRRCGRCVEICPYKALSQAADGSLLIDRTACVTCGMCATACGSGALKIFGTVMSVDEVLAEVAKDAPFYKRSGGGLTVSGGEALAQPAFLLQLLREAKARHHFNVVLETSLYGDADALRDILPYVDHVFADLKLYDTARHSQVIGVSNTRILNNIRLLAAELPPQAELIIRLPLMPAINDDPDNLRATADFIRSLPRDIPLEVLPGHEYGSGKYAALGKSYLLSGSQLAERSVAAAAQAREVLAAYGVRVIVT